jgi:hypothetical protein
LKALLSFKKKWKFHLSETWLPTDEKKKRNHQKETRDKQIKNGSQKNVQDVSDENSDDFQLVLGGTR